MLFNSIKFLLFFPVVCLLYAIIPRKLRYLWLLAASYFFYMCWNAKYTFLIAVSTFVTWTSFLMNRCILGVFKYADFFVVNLNWLLGHVGMELVGNPFDFVLPVGDCRLVLKDLRHIGWAFSIQQLVAARKFHGLRKARKKGEKRWFCYDGCIVPTHME